MSLPKWTTDSRGERIPEYTVEQLKRIAEAAWRINGLVPHPDDAHSDEDTANIREFNRALKDLPKLPTEHAGDRAKVVRRLKLPRSPDGTINNCALANWAPEDECQMCKNDCPDAAVAKGGAE